MIAATQRAGESARRIRRLSAACLALAASGVLAQSAAPLTLRDYLDAVAQRNPALQAQRETINAAQAGVSVAGVRPDPQFTGGIASKELYGPNKPNAATATTAGVSFTLETAGKHGARVRAAQSSLRLTEANVALFKRQLEADASAAFVEVCRTRAVVLRKESSLAAMRDIVRANELRLRAGDIGRLEFTQSRLEAEKFQADVTTARGDTQAAEVSLNVFLGQTFDAASAPRPIDCEWRAQAGDDDVEVLVRGALAQREDVRAAQAAVDNARDGVALARSNRWVDPSVSVALTNTPPVPPVLDAGGGVANSPARRSLTMSLLLTVPIPLSRLQDGELRQAASAQTQAQLQQRSVLTKAEGEVRATFAQYRAAQTNLAAYRDHVLADAQRVLESSRTSYRKGASSLVELLNAQRSADDIHLAYLQAVADRANALVRLQLSSGLPPAL